MHPGTPVGAHTRRAAARPGRWFGARPDAASARPPRGDAHARERTAPFARAVGRGRGWSGRPGAPTGRGGWLRDPV